MLSGISVICFATSYTVALLLEVSRLFYRSGIRGAVMFVFAGLGLFTHTVFLYHQAVHAAGYPLSNKQDWYFLAAWVLATIYLYLSHYHPKTPFGVFLLPIVLGLIGAGKFWADPTPFAERPALAVWYVVHGTSLLLTTVAVAVGFVSGVMYLEQARRLKRKLPPRGGLQLPSLEWLGRVNGRSIVLAIILLALGIISGMVLNSIHLDNRDRRISLADPLVFGTLAMFVWLVVSAGTSFLYRPAREGHKVAYLTVLSFAFLVVVLGLFLGIRHGQEALPQDREAFRSIPPAWRYPADIPLAAKTDTNPKRKRGTQPTAALALFEVARDAFCRETHIVTRSVSEGTGCHRERPSLTLRVTLASPASAICTTSNLALRVGVMLPKTDKLGRGRHSLLKTVAPDVPSRVGGTA